MSRQGAKAAKKINISCTKKQTQNTEQ